MTAAMLVLEPIFEADLPPEQYGSLGGDDQNWAADETPGFDFGALSPPEQIAKAVEWGAIIYPQYKNQFDNGRQHNPSTLGCSGHWSDDARRLHYRNLCAIDGRLVLAGEHVSCGLAGGDNPVGARCGEATAPARIGRLSASCGAGQ